MSAELMTGAQLMEEAAAFAAANPGAFDGLLVLIDEAIEEGRVDVDDLERTIREEAAR